MKKIRICSVILFLFSVAVFGVYLYYAKATSDTIAPVVTCETEEMTVSVFTKEAELLAGVTAQDDRSGDVSDTLVIEKISAFTGENTRIVTYAAIDEKGNVGRCQRTLYYEDYQKPTFSLTEAMRFPTGQSVDILGRIKAYSELDGDLTDNIKYSLDSTIDLKTPNIYNVEFRVTDSADVVEYLSLDIEVYDASAERIEVVLSEYLVYVPANAEFDPMAYYVGSDIEGELVIESAVDTTKEGVYNVDYIVNGNNSKGKSRLIVIVTAP